MFGRKKPEQVNAETIDTQGRKMPPRTVMPEMMQAPQAPQPQYIPPPPPIQPPMPAEMQTFIDQYRLFEPESFNAPGVYEATVCNLLYGIYAEIHKANSQR